MVVRTARVEYLAVSVEVVAEAKTDKEQKDQLWAAWIASAELAGTTASGSVTSEAAGKQLGALRLEKSHSRS